MMVLLFYTILEGLHNIWDGLEDSAGAAILSIVGYVVIVFILIPLFKYLYKVSSPYLKKVGERALIQYRKHPYAYIFVPAGVIYIIGVIYILMTS